MSSRGPSPAALLRFAATNRAPGSEMSAGASRFMASIRSILQQFDSPSRSLLCSSTSKTLSSIRSQHTLRENSDRLVSVCSVLHFQHLWIKLNQHLPTLLWTYILGGWLLVTTCHLRRHYWSPLTLRGHHSVYSGRVLVLTVLFLSSWSQNWVHVHMFPPYALDDNGSWLRTASWYGFLHPLQPW